MPGRLFECTRTQGLHGTTVHQLEDAVQLDVLDAAKLDTISRKAQAYTQHLQVLMKQKKAAAPNSEHDQQIQQMFETMQKWEGAAKELPGVVARMRTLQVKHGLCIEPQCVTAETAHGRILNGGWLENDGEEAY